MWKADRNSTLYARYHHSTGHLCLITFVKPTVTPSFTLPVIEETWKIRTKSRSSTSPYNMVVVLPGFLDVFKPRIDVLEIDHHQRSSNKRML